jgi:sortase A
MRLMVPKHALLEIIRWTKRIFVACAIVLLAHTGYVLLDGWLFQIRERSRLERQLEHRESTSVARTPILPGGLIGRIEIPRLDLSVIVMEGVEGTTLRRAAGHIPGTALPGQTGNVGIAGHRDTLFRELRNIRRNDLITLVTPLGEYRYRVVSTKIVTPRDVTVLDPDGNEILTLVTCYPFYFVGSAPDRFIVRAERIETTADAGRIPLLRRPGVFRAQLH